MMNGSERVNNSELERLFPGDSDLARRMRDLDWSQTDLGPPQHWPQSLQTAVQILLHSRYPMFVWWGQGFTNLYNDAYAPMLGTRHPQALGQSAPVVWADVWDVVGPQAEAVLYEGRSSWNEELLLIMERYGYPEETYFTFSYSPVADDTGGIGGVFCAVIEDTARVLGQRRLRTLRELAALTAQAKRAEEVCQLAARAIGENPYDVPFALFYLFDAGGEQARLSGTAGVEEGTPGATALIDVGEEKATRFMMAMRSGEPVPLGDLVSLIGVTPKGPWTDPPRHAMVLPLEQTGQEQPAGFVVAGISPRLVLDDEYRGFLGLLAGHVASAIANARAYEAERKRAEALAELDRAKTAFFSNVSHEFRTPLTLMLGPMEDLLAKSDGGLATEDRAQVQAMHRNGLRLLKLVNTLLDFSRIEAGRIQAVYEPIDLGTYTAELASVFRAAVERAGMRLLVDCPPLPEPIYVDREMWEKIVLNFLSNAFKFTFAGEIAVGLRWAVDHVELSVRDTGTGIPADELPHIFTRFYRIRGAQARTHEGSGIGLALVQELVKLHGGLVAVTSTLGHGSTFTVAIPTGTAHLPPERVGAARTLTSTALGGEAYVEEALRWLPEVGNDAVPAADFALSDVQSRWSLAETSAQPGVSAPHAAHILLADDNADMRQYLTRLLGRRWTVEAVPDGAAVLAAARARVPDLILTDVMMPGLDGFALLRELRADVRTREVPVIILSARAGEESRVEGLEAGADDYLIKPFSARELMARVGAHLELARVRREAADAVRDGQERLNLAMQAAGMGTWDVDLRTGKALWSESHFTLLGYEAAPTGEATFEMWRRCVHPEDRHRVTEAFERARLERSIYRLEYRIVRADNGMHVWLSVAGRFLYDEAGEAVRFIGVFFDITERKLAEKEMLLKEIHHRVKNNLQVVASLLYLQADQLKDSAAAAVFEDTQNRIRSMALIHESLYRTGDLAHFNFADYIENLRTHLCQSYAIGASRISLHTDLDRLAFDVDTAIPCGLLLNELLTNALKYAFPEGHSGDIYITLRGDAEHVTLCVRDTGIGLSEDFDFRRTESLGLQLVSMLTEQLGGTIELTGGSGTMCAVTFPYPIHQRTAEAQAPGAGPL